MPKSTLTEVFGAGATQTATSWTIQKADFPTLEAAISNSGSSLLAALLLRLKTVLTQAAYDADIEKSIYLQSSDFPSILPRGEQNTPYRIDQITINLSKPDTVTELDPDNY
ncbi:hypothetical protein [Anabaena lutea]|uniref:Uncharacterized protein n=1 Tax=Anabaena lutea FACHB-196 TaxID=2692881 RepID=A0ABR8FQP9_9NOST|nr:hypothetical protein [Anabaena lutea]MBD2571061.1 hypothetical protein [Anabaena lutea FACHB-196]